MKHQYSMILALPVLLAVLAGCSDAPPDPPLSQCDMAIRFFDSLDGRDYRAAREQLGKLRATGINSPGIASIEEAVNFNIIVKDAQELIDADRLDEARELLVRAQQHSAGNQILLLPIAELDKLIQLRGELQKLRDPAAVPETQRAAIEAVEAILAAYPPGEILRPELDARREALDRLEEAERLRAEAEAQAAAAETEAAAKPAP